MKGNDESYRRATPKSAVGKRNSAPFYRTHLQDSRNEPPTWSSTLPDLRFLNHNNPPVTASSLLDPSSVNSANIQQRQALQEAESWYTTTAVMLRQRLLLCERLKDGLGEINSLLNQIETARVTETRDRGSNGSEIDSVKNECEAKDPATNVENVSVGSGETAAFAATEDRSKVSSQAAQEVGSSRDRLEILEDAVDSWLRDVRISRAKWIAGGRDMERRIGLR